MALSHFVCLTSSASAPRFILSFLLLPRSPTYLSCLAIGHFSSVLKQLEGALGKNTSLQYKWIFRNSSLQQKWFKQKLYEYLL